MNRTGRIPTMDAEVNACPLCGTPAAVPKWFPLRPGLRFRDEARRAISAHGYTAGWFACCRVFGIWNSAWHRGHWFAAAYRPGEGFVLKNADTQWPDFYKLGTAEIEQRLDRIALGPNVGPWRSALENLGRVRLVVAVLVNMVEAVHQELFGAWLSCAAPGAPVAVADATPFQFASRYWPPGGHATIEAPPEALPELLSAALRAPEAQLPFAHTAWATPDLAVRMAFRHYLGQFFGTPRREGPTLLVCLRWNKRRWDRGQTEDFLRLCRDRLSARIIVQGVTPGTKGNGVPPDLPRGVEPLIDATIPEQIEAARAATYVVMPHGAAMLWSWISGAPTLEMYPSREVQSNMLHLFSTLPLGANVWRMTTNSTGWDRDFDEPTAEEVFAAMMGHVEESGAMLE